MRDQTQIFIQRIFNCFASPFMGQKKNFGCVRISQSVFSLFAFTIENTQILSLMQTRSVMPESQLSVFALRRSLGFPMEIIQIHSSMRIRSWKHFPLLPFLFERSSFAGSLVYHTWLHDWGSCCQAMALLCGATEDSQSNRPCGNLTLTDGFFHAWITNSAE